MTPKDHVGFLWEKMEDTAKEWSTQLKVIFKALAFNNAKLIIKLVVQELSYIPTFDLFWILGDKVTVKIGKEGSKESMKKVLKKDQVSNTL